MSKAAMKKDNDELGLPKAFWLYVVSTVVAVLLTSVMCYVGFEAVKVSSVIPMVEANSANIKEIKSQNNYTEIQKVIITLETHEKILNEIRIDVKKIMYEGE